MSGSIEGKVINQRDSEAIEGASLTLNGEGTQKETTSGAEGDFRFADLEVGQYELTVTKKGFDDGVFGPIVVVEGVATKLLLSLLPKTA